MNDGKILNAFVQNERQRLREMTKERMDRLKNPPEKPNIPLPSECKTTLAWFRKLRGLTQQQLSEESGVNLPMIQKYEAGIKDINKAQGMTLYKLAQALDCKIEELLEL